MMILFIPHSFLSTPPSPTEPLHFPTGPLTPSHLFFGPAEFNYGCLHGRGWEAVHWSMAHTPLATALERDSPPHSLHVALPTSSFSFAHGLSFTVFHTPVTSSYSWGAHRAPEMHWSRSLPPQANTTFQVLRFSSSISSPHYAQKENF